MFILFPKICFANSAVILYKFSANNGTDWVEIFNNGSEDINLYGYYIEDGTSKVEDLSCILKAEGHYFINCGVRLNMNSDVILLKDSSGELVDCVAYGDEKCSGRESCVL